VLLIEASIYILFKFNFVINVNINLSNWCKTLTNFLSKSLLSVLVIIFEKIARSLAGVKGGFILKVVLYFIYFFVAFFVVDSLISLVFPIEFDVYTNLITAFIFAVFMTPLLFVLKQDKNKK